MTWMADLRPMAGSCRQSMILSDLPSPAEAGCAKAGNRFPLFGIMLQLFQGPDANRQSSTRLSQRHEFFGAIRDHAVLTGINDRPYGSLENPISFVPRR
jgi:hypothetical protein